MEPESANTHETVDRLLASGRITEDEHARLREALDASPPADGANEGPPPPLVRPGSEAMVSGVCTALARRHGWEVNIVRVVFVLLLFFAMPVVLLAYVAATLLIPRDDNPRLAPPGKGSVAAFFTSACLVYVLLPMLISSCILPSMVELFSNMKGNLPFALRLYVFFWHLLRNLFPLPYGAPVRLGLSCLLMATILTVVYKLLPAGVPRRLYAYLALLGGVLFWTIPVMWWLIVLPGMVERVR